MDWGTAEAIISEEDARWADYPVAVKMLVLRMLTGMGEDGQPDALPVISARFAGEFDYRTGTDGIPEIPEGARVVSIACDAHDGQVASLTIDGGNPIAIRAGGRFSVSPEGRLVSPEIIFTDTHSYFVELVMYA